MKPVRVVFLDEAKEEYKRLNQMVEKQDTKNSPEMKLLISINQKVELIKANPFYGDNIRKDQIPKEYHVQNLWRVQLVGYWRMLYTIKGDNIEILCFVLDILDHKRYDKMFGYRKR